MALRGRSRATHLVSKNRKIRIWHRQLGHASNTRVIRAATLVNGINLQKAKYDPSEVFVNSEESEHDSSNEDNTAKDDNVVDKSEQNTDTAVAALIFQTFATDPTLDSALETSTIDPDPKKLCITCVASKSTRTIKRHKNMTPANDKLEEVHADFWGPHDLPSRSGNVYTTILICEHTRKTWTFYLQSKDEFIDVFQLWLPQVEAKSSCKMKVL